MNKKYWVIIILSGILLFHFINNFIWLSANNNWIEGCDGMCHMREAISFQLSLKTIRYDHQSFLEKIAEVHSLFREWPTPNWPPFVYLLSCLVNPDDFSFFRTRLYVNFIFYVLLVLSTYFLGKKCFNRRVGLIAAFLISFYPSFYAFSRQFGLDFPLASVAAVSTCLLVYSENFSKRSYSLLFGLSFGIATLVKLQIILFILAPLIYSILKIFNEENSHKLRSFFNFLLSLIISYFLFSLYWGAKLKDMLMNAGMHIFSLYPFWKGEILPRCGPACGLATSIFSWENFTFYPRCVLYHSSSWLFGLFILAFLAFFIRRNKWRTFFLLNLLLPYLFLTFISVKWARYALPILMPMSIISACFIDGLRFRYFKIIVLGCVFFYCLGFNLSSSWRINRNYPPFFYSNLYSHPPDPNDFVEVLKTKGIISLIENRLRKDGRISIRHIGVNSSDIINFLYLYFQNSIFSLKIDIKRITDFDSSSLKDVDYIIADLSRTNANFVPSESGTLFPIEELLKSYKIRTEINGAIFLERI